MTSINQAPVAVITGASSGIGAATARLLATELPTHITHASLRNS